MMRRGPSVTCQEIAPLDTPASFLRAALPGRESIADSYKTFLPFCEIWGVPPVPASEYQPEWAAIPALVFSGELDPVTPPEFGKWVAAALPISRHYTFPATGHGQATKPCPNSIITAFFGDPSRWPSADCIFTMPPLPSRPPADAPGGSEK